MYMTTDLQSWLMAMLSNIFKGVCMCVKAKNTEHSPDPGKADNLTHRQQTLYCLALPLFV